MEKGEPNCWFFSRSVFIIQQWNARGDRIRRGADVTDRSQSVYSRKFSRLNGRHVMPVLIQIRVAGV